MNFQIPLTNLPWHNYLTKPLEPETFVTQLLELLVDDMPDLKQLLG